MRTIEEFIHFDSYISSIGNFPFFTCQSKFTEVPQKGKVNKEHSVYSKVNTSQ